MAALTKLQIQTVRFELATAINNVLARHGMTAELGTIRYTPDSFRCKLEATSDKPKTGLTVEAVVKVGQKFRIKSRIYEVTGFNPRRWKYNVTAIRLPDGKRFKVSYAMVQKGAL